MPHSDNIWRSPPTNLALPDDEVHVWRASLNQSAAHVEWLAQTLAADERERAGRFYFEKHRRHFIVGRGLLRTILGGYLGIEPASLGFGYTDYGKPVLAEPSDPAGRRLAFNLSHSHEMVLYGFTYGREIGIDVEYLLRPGTAGEKIAERFFSPQEVKLLRSLPKRLWREAFFNCWTRKEAYIKASGEGLSLPLHQFDVSLRPGEPAALLETRGDPQEASRWSLRALSPGPNYAAALVVEGQGWQLRCWQYQFGQV